MDKMRFEWDPRKDLDNQDRHGVPFELAQYAFADPRRVIAEDLTHSKDEKRYFCFGSLGEGILTVRFNNSPGFRHPDLWRRILEERKEDL